MVARVEGAGVVGGCLGWLKHGAGGGYLSWWKGWACHFAGGQGGLSFRVGAGKVLPFLVWQEGLSFASWEGRSCLCWRSRKVLPLVGREGGPGKSHVFWRCAAIVQQ